MNFNFTLPNLKESFLAWRQISLFTLILIFGTAAMAQKTVTGTVSNSAGDSLVGVTVIIQGTTEGAQTDTDGEYSVIVPSDDAVLIFSFLGYQTQEVAVNGQSTLNVTLVEGDLTTDEVVITALGIEREQKSLTYATQNVDPEALTEARELNVVNSLSGKVAGLSISRSGAGVGAPSRVILRGNRSISGDSQPLYVVDGVPILGDITDINPDDIESISVLKGPNAAALYGNRANNGAIIITTKQGQRGFNVSLSSTLTAEVPIIFRDYQNEFGQGNAGQYNPGSEDSWGAPLDGRQVEHWSPDPNFPVETYSYEAQPDNVEDFYRTGYNSASSLAISTGNEKNQTYFSYTYTNAGGVVPNNELRRHNINFRITNEIGEKLTLDGKLTYLREDIKNEIAQGENFANPNRHAYRLPRNIRTEDIEQFEYTDAEGNNRQHYWNPGSNGGANPYWTLNRNLNDADVDRVIAFASMRYEVTPELSIMLRSAFDRLFRKNETRLFNDSYIIADNGVYSLTHTESYEWNNDVLVSYSTDLTPDFALELNVGGNLRSERGSSLNGNVPGGIGLTVPNFFTLSNTQLVAASNSFGAPRDVNSVYGFGQLSYRNAIFLDFTARNDWSSTLPEENWSFFYPSVGLNVVLTDLFDIPEPFSFIKLRGSYAQVGNDTSPFQLQRTASVSPGGANGYLALSGTLPNENLEPEETESIELGADLRFLEGRIALDFTYYKTNSTNQLFTVALPVGSGASSFFTNGGDVENEGVEGVLTLSPIRSGNLDWDITFNYTRNRSTVVEINDERPRIQVASDFLRAYFIEEGEQFGNVYSRGFQRDEQGRVLIGEDGLPLITPGRTVLVGNYNPDWLGGILNTFRWKDLTFSFLIDIRQGGGSASITDAIIFGGGHVEETLQGRDGSLVFGENFLADETAVLASDGSPNNLTMNAEAYWNLVGGRNAPVGEAFARDASNIRMREITLGYRLSIPNSPLRAVKVSFVGRNLFFFQNKAETFDPEVLVGTGKAAEGFESFSPPTARSFGVNVKFDF